MPSHLDIMREINDLKAANEMPTANTLYGRYGISPSLVVAALTYGRPFSGIDAFWFRLAVAIRAEQTGGGRAEFDAACEEMQAHIDEKTFDIIAAAKAHKP